MAKKAKRKKRRSKKKQSSGHSPYRTWAIYGDSGVGKTTLAATAPKPMILDSNQGLMSIDGRPGFEHVRSTTISSMAGLNRAYSNFTGTGRRNWSRRYQTAVFDHFDDIQGIVLDELTERAAERDERRQADDPAPKEYGVMGNRLRRYIRKFKSVPVHKVMIFSVGMDRETGKLTPNLVGALRNQLPYFCDVIMYMRTGKGGKRYIYLQDTPRFLAKCRAWWLPNKRIEVPKDDTTFLTRLFDQIAAGPKKSK